MQITLFGVLFGLLLLIVPLYLMQYYGISLWRKTFIAVLKMTLLLGLTGVFMFVIFQRDSLWLNLLWIVIEAIAASAVVVGRCRTVRRRMMMPVLIGLLLSSLVIGLYFLFFVIGLKNPFDTRYFVPVLGLLIGSLVEMNVKALSAYYAGLAYHNQLYYYLIGNGATHAEAVNHFVRRALQQSATPALSQMGSMMLSQAPVIMWVMLMNGQSVVNSVLFQLLVMLLIFCTSTVSVVVTLLSARRYSFDPYGDIKVNQSQR